jgi:hypothetical protein
MTGIPDTEVCTDPTPTTTATTTIIQYKPTKCTFSKLIF